VDRDLSTLVGASCRWSSQHHIYLREFSLGWNIRKSDILMAFYEICVVYDDECVKTRTTQKILFATKDCSVEDQLGEGRISQEL